MTFVTRAITGTSLCAIAGFLLFVVDSSLFHFASLAITTVIAYEWSFLCGVTAKRNRIFYVFAFTLIILALYITESMRTLLEPIIIMGSLAWSIAIVLILSCRQRSYNWLLVNKCIMLPVGYVLLASFLIALNYLYLQHIWLLSTLLLASMSFDTFAYITGKWLGKRKLCPHISPGKTWEGAFFGFVLSAISVLILIEILLYFQVIATYMFTSYLLLSIVAIVVSLFGDLFESLLKRVHGYKDSGSLLPGHGGFLDRFDSYLAVLPVSAFFVFQFNV